ncbi:MAG TPA: pyruvate kinase [Acidobacteriaceae bacterium]|jgi:pyruvate kinase|nr:pyruvate kinase [Acidobacteriaceae bacterium]
MQSPVATGAPPARRAKIICTIGPACSTEAVMRDLLRLGMDIARLNFSHGTHEDHARHIQRLRRAAEREGRTVCILQDLQGPKIRTGPLEDHEPVMLKTGSVVTITPQNITGTATRICTTFPDLARELSPGARILLSDGLIELRVRAVQGKDRGKDVLCEVINGGLLGEHKGINLPGIALSIPALTEKDRKDLEFGLTHGVDAVALSFVRTAADVTTVKQIIAAHNSDLPVIAKLEKPQAIDHLEEILEAADGVMVARGDLGVEMAPEKVPVIQKHVIRRASVWRKPVITATQMLESMIENPRPTRAEASDVANAIFDGTDAVMLSAETASGQYPRESVSIMSRIAIEAECNMDDFVQFRRRRREHRGLTIAETICESIAHAAEDLPMGAIAVFTETGNTVRMISKFRPPVAIYAYTHSAPVVNRMNLYWGVHPVRCRQAHSAEQMVTMAEQDLVRRGLLKPADVLGVVAGTRQASGSTNLMRLHVVTSEEAESIAQKKPAPKKPRSKKSHAQK